MDEVSGSFVGARAGTSLLEVFRWVWPALMTIGIAAIVVPLDLSIADGTFILGFTQRMLDGQVPHADFISLRPAGSPIFHMLDHAVPLPLLTASRLVAVVQVVAYSAALGLLLTGTARWGRLGLAASAGVAASALVNFHVFPAMAWPTIDGIFFSALGLLLIDRGLREARTRITLLGCLLVGAAPLMKQSFFIMPVVASLWLIGPIVAKRRWRALAQIWPPLTAMAVPGLLYLAVVVAAGGFGNMVTELTGAAPVFGRPASRRAAGRRRGSGASARCGPSAVSSPLRPCWTASSCDGCPERRVSGRGIILRIVITLVIAKVCVAGGLDWKNPWPFRIFWAAAVTAVVTSVIRRRIDLAGVAVVALGYSATLSYGVPEPGLAAGSMAFYIVVRAWQAPGLDRTGSTAGGTSAFLAAGALGLSLMLAWLFVDVRSEKDYLTGRKAALLTQNLGEVSPPPPRSAIKPGGRRIPDVGPRLHRQSPCSTGRRHTRRLGARRCLQRPQPLPDGLALASGVRTARGAYPHRRGGPNASVARDAT